VTLERLTRAALGSRVVVRYLIEDGDRATDVIGILSSRTAESLSVLTHDGRVDIPMGDVVAGKPVPPAPERRRR